MCNFLNVPILDINCTYQMFAHRSCVIPFTKITMFPYSEQVQDIEHYDASVGDDLDAKLSNSSKSNGLYGLLVIEHYGVDDNLSTL